MLNECIEGLNINPDGIYVDGTLGGAGHSKEIAKRLSQKGMLIGIDRDEEALKAAKENLKEFSNVKYVHGNHDEIKEILQLYDPDLASKITEKNFNSKLSKFKSKCNKLALLLERLTSFPVIKDWLKSNFLENENSSFSPDLEKFKDCPIDLSSEDSPFRRSVARLKAYFKGLNDIPEQKLSDGELLDDVPVSFQMN